MQECMCIEFVYAYSFLCEDLSFCCFAINPINNINNNNLQDNNPNPCTSVDQSHQSMDSTNT